MTSRDLLLAILSMDAYNQGYAQGIEHGSTQIGTARFREESNTRAGGDSVGPTSTTWPVSAR